MKKEEIRKYIAGESNIIGVPCGLWMHFPASCAIGEASTMAHLEYYSKTNVSVMKLMNEHPMKFSIKIECADDWGLLDVQSIDECVYDDFISEIKEFRKRIGGDAFLIVTIHGVLVSACHATDGMGHFPDLKNTVTMHLKEKPEVVTKGLKSIGAVLEKLCSRCFDAGADGIYYAALGGEENRFTESMYRTYVSPIEKRILESCKKKGFVFLHVCKDNPRLSMFSDYPCDVVNWDEHRGLYSIEDGMKLFPGKVILGGFDNKRGVLFSGSDDDVIRHIKDVFKCVGRGRIMIGADCTLPSDFSIERISMISNYCSNI